MPVIRVKPKIPIVEPERWKQLVEQLARELSGEAVDGGPLIFEIPFGGSGRMDVLVVWDQWQGVRSEDRTAIILEAYGDQAESVAQGLGVTIEETLEQQLLPYSVTPMTRRDEVDRDALRQAMIGEGAIQLAGGRVELRFPTMAMAEAAHARLCEKLPRGYWSIVQSTSSSGG